MARASKELSDSLNASAGLFIKSAEKRFNIKLDFSEESLIVADDLISVFFRMQRRFSLVAAGFLGAYLGYALISSAGGRWSSERLIEKIGPMKGKANPFAKAVKRLENGKNDSFMPYVKSIKLTMTMDTGFAKDNEKLEGFYRTLREDGWTKRLISRIASESEPENLRGEYAEILGRMGSSDDVPQLIALLKRPQFASCAAAALQGIPDERAFMPLMDALCSGDQLLRINAAMALGAIGNPGAVGALVSMLSDDNEIAAHYASMALAKMPHDMTEDAILESDAMSDAERKQYCIFALSESGSIKSIPRIIESLFSSDYSVKEAAVTAFQAISDESAFKPLSFMISDPSARIRVLAAYAIAGFGKEKAVPLISRLLDDPVPSARIHASRLLQWLGKGQEPPRCH